MRWPLGIKTSTKTAEEHEARIKDLQTQRFWASTEEIARWHHGDLEWRKQALMDSYQQQAREGWVVMKAFQPFPVKVLKLAERSTKLICPGPEPVRPWGASPYGDAVPPLVNPSFRTLTLQRGEGYINEAGELVVVL